MNIDWRAKTQDELVPLLADFSKDFAREDSRRTLLEFAMEEILRLRRQLAGYARYCPDEARGRP